MKISELADLVRQQYGEPDKKQIIKKIRKERERWHFEFKIKRPFSVISSRRLKKILKMK